MSEYWLRRGGQRSLYVAAPTGDLPKWVAPGDSLVGSLLVNKDAKKVSEVKLVYEVPPPKNEIRYGVAEMIIVRVSTAAVWYCSNASLVYKRFGLGQRILKRNGNENSDRNA